MTTPTPASNAGLIELARKDFIGPDERYGLTFYLGDVTAIRPVDPDEWDVHLPGMPEPVRVKGRPWLAEHWRELKGRANG